MKQKQLTPALSIRRFKTLHTYSPDSQIQDEEFSKAENVVMDDDGVITVRPALQAWITSPVDTVSRTTNNLYPTEGNTYYAGSLYPGPDIPGGLKQPIHVFYFGEGGYFYKNAKDWAYYGSDMTLPTPPAPTFRWPMGAFWYSTLVKQVDPLNGPMLSTFGAPWQTDWQTRGFQYPFDPITGGSGGPPFSEYLFCGSFWGQFYDAVPDKLSQGAIIGADLIVHQYDEPGMGTDGQCFITHTCLHKDRSFGFSVYDLSTSGSKCRVYFSKPGTPDQNEGFIDISSLADGRLNALVSYRDNLYVFKSESLWVLYTPGAPQSWTLRKLADVGCLGITPVVSGGSIYWVAPDGCYQWDGNTIQRLSDTIQDIWWDHAIYDGNYDWGKLGATLPPPLSTATIPNVANHSQYAWVRATIYRGSYIIVLNMGNIKRVFCYNIKHKFWSEWTFGGLESKITDVFSIDRDNTNIGENNGIYFCVSNNFKSPTIYKMSDEVSIYGDDVQDDNVLFASKMLGSSTGGTTFTTVNPIPAGLDLSGKQLRFTFGNDKFKIIAGTSFFFLVVSNTTGAGSTITVNSNPPTFQITDHDQPFYVSQRSDITVKLRTKRWDMGNPNSLKRFSKCLIQAQNWSPINIAMEGMGVVPVQDLTIRTVGSFSRQPVQGLIAAGGNFRSQSLLIDLQADGYGPTVAGGPSGADLSNGDVPLKFKLYGIDVYAVDHGQQDAPAVPPGKQP